MSRVSLAGINIYNPIVLGGGGNKPVPSTPQGKKPVPFGEYIPLWAGQLFGDYARVHENGKIVDKTCISENKKSMSHRRVSFYKKCSFRTGAKECFPHGILSYWLKDFC